MLGAHRRDSVPQICSPDICSIRCDAVHFRKRALHAQVCSVAKFKVLSKVNWAVDMLVKIVVDVYVVVKTQHGRVVNIKIDVTKKLLAAARLTTWSPSQ